MFDRMEDAFAASVLDGLAQNPKRLEPKWFYDARGSALFDQICDLPEYYPTRTEAAILRDAAPEIAAEIGPGVVLYEPGAGSAEKARVLLDMLDSPAAFAPADICLEHVEQAAETLRADYPGLRIEALPLDFTARLALPEALRQAGPLVIFFPGSTIGNLQPADAAALMQRFRSEAGAEQLLIGVDLIKDEETLVAAYDDAAGVTAAFNRNLLVRIACELGADIDPDDFAHVAVFNRAESRVEMHLESRRDHTVTIRGQSFAFRAGERICTEHSYKYTPEGFIALAGKAGWQAVRHWTDASRQFGLFLFRPDASAPP
jgi:dimethylhistidine N-methyltransferase